MQTCTNCGEKRKGNEKFCVECGNVFADKQPVRDAVSPKPERKKRSITPKQKKRRVFGIVSAAVILLGLIGGHLFLKSKYDASNTLISMNQAFTAGDEAEFLSYFQVADSVYKDEEGFYSFIEEEGWEDLRSDMTREAERLETDALSNIILDSEGNKLVSVLEEPVLLGLYNQVSFMLHPVKLSVETTFDGMKFTVEDSEITGKAGEQHEVGEFLPGSYNWNTVIASEIMPIEQSGELNIVNSGNNTFVYTPLIEAGMVDVTSDLPDAVMWINGESTKKTIKETKSFGPVLMNGSVEITAETENDKGEIVKGEPMSVESDSIHITFAHVQEKVAAERAEELEQKKLQQLAETHEYDVANFIDSFRSSFETALNYADFSYIADYFPTGSKVQADYLADMERHADMDDYYYYNFQSNTITDFEVIDETTFEVTTAEMFYFDSDSDRLRYNKTKAYTVVLLHDQYYIQEIEQLTTEKESM